MANGNPLVIKDDDRLGGRLVGNIRVGWRVPCTDGHVDVMWGSTKDEASLKLLLEDVKRQYGEKEIIDERSKAGE